MNPLIHTTLNRFLALVHKIVLILQIGSKRKQKVHSPSPTFDSTLKLFLMMGKFSFRSVAILLCSDSPEIKLCQNEQTLSNNWIQIRQGGVAIKYPGTLGISATILTSRRCMPM